MYFLLLMLERIVPLVPGPAACRPYMLVSLGWIVWIAPGSDNTLRRLHIRYYVLAMYLRLHDSNTRLFQVSRREPTWSVSVISTATRSLRSRSTGDGDLDLDAGF